MQPRSENKNPTNRRKRVSVLIKVCFGILVLAVFVQLLVVWIFRSPLSEPQVSFQGDSVYNPYRWKSGKAKWWKASLHMHSNSIWYTPEMHSPREIGVVYAKHGYDIIGISDYNVLTPCPSETCLGEYEWGSNLEKKHFLVLGADKILPDRFPLFSTLENVQWSLDQLQGESRFIVLNHPDLFHSFDSEDLLQLEGYDALEVFSPFVNEDLSKWDDLLSHGKKIWSMSSDDLHYLPDQEETSESKTSVKIFWKLATFTYDRAEGEALTRYIEILSPANSRQEIFKALRSGSFVSVKKFDRNFPDPDIVAMGIKDKEVSIQLSEPALEIRFIGQGGKILEKRPNAGSASYRFREEDTYVRIEVVAKYGLLVSNPFFRYSSSDAADKSMESEIP